MIALHTAVAVVALGLASLLWLLSVAYVRRYREVVLTWKQTELVFVTLGCFVAVLTLFLLGCFFGAAYLGRLEGIQLLQIEPHLLGLLAMDCLLGMVAAVMVYLAFRNFFTQFITREGIYLTRWPNLLARQHAQQQLLRWEAIKDHYQHSDYPITRYRFLTVGPEGTLERHELAVPFYVLPRFEALLEATLERQQQQREQQRQRQRKAWRQD